eukprot:scaffold122553_cov39-Phaeocystis_antarctica.AAC.1
MGVRRASRSALVSSASSRVPTILACVPSPHRPSVTCRVPLLQSLKLPCKQACTFSCASRTWATAEPDAAGAWRTGGPGRCDAQHAGGPAGCGGRARAAARRGSRPWPPRRAPLPPPRARASPCRPCRSLASPASRRSAARGEEGSPPSHQSRRCRRGESPLEKRVGAVSPVPDAALRCKDGGVLVELADAGLREELPEDGGRHGAAAQLGERRVHEGEVAQPSTQAPQQDADHRPRIVRHLRAQLGALPALILAADVRGVGLLDDDQRTRRAAHVGGLRPHEVYGRLVEVLGLGVGRTREATQQAHRPPVSVERVRVAHLPAQRVAQLGAHASSSGALRQHCVHLIVAVLQHVVSRRLDARGDERGGRLHVVAGDTPSCVRAQRVVHLHEVADVLERLHAMWCDHRKSGLKSTTCSTTCSSVRPKRARA